MFKIKESLMGEKYLNKILLLLIIIKCQNVNGFIMRIASVCYNYCMQILVKLIVNIEVHLFKMFFLVIRQTQSG